MSSAFFARGAIFRPGFSVLFTSVCATDIYRFCTDASKDILPRASWPGLARVSQSWPELARVGQSDKFRYKNEKILLWKKKHSIDFMFGYPCWPVCWL